MTINGVQVAGYRQYVPGGGGGGDLKACPGVSEGINNRSFSKGGVEQHTSLSKGVGQNRSLSRQGAFTSLSWGDRGII